MNITIDYDNFFLPANDLNQAKDFYSKTLGLTIKFDFPDKGMTAFGVGNNEPAIILSSRPDAAPAIWFKVDNVRQIYDNLKLKGIKFFSEPFQIMTGYAVEFEDPFGNRLGLTDYSKAKQAL